MVKPIAAVIGATGAQGFSVVKALAASGRYQIRAGARNPDGPSAQKLKDLSPDVHIVKCDTGKDEDVLSFFKGADVAYGTTFPGTNEEEHGKRMVDKVIEAKLKFFIWSSSPHPGQYKAKILELKVNVNNYLDSHPDINACTLYLPWYMENLSEGGMVRNEGDKVVLEVPRMPEDLKVHFLATNPDVGNATLKIFDHVLGSNAAQPSLKHKKLILGDRTKAYNSHRHIKDMLAELTGKEVVYRAPACVEPEGGDFDVLFASRVGNRGHALTFEKDQVPSPELEQLGVEVTPLDSWIRDVLAPLVSSGKAVTLPFYYPQSS